MSSQSPAEQSNDRTGLLYGISAYVLWGGMPLYLALLKPAGPIEILCHRICWSFVLCMAIIAVRRQISSILTIVRNKRMLGALALAGAIISVNWVVYILAVVTDRVVDASLGYFINPLVTVLLAVVLLHERLRIMQWIAIGIAAVAVVVITVGFGQVPWIALTLAVSFALYGYVKKLVGTSVPALEGLTIETGIMTPLALIGLIVIQILGQSHFVGFGAWHVILMIGTGVITAVPLLLFNGAARRLNLSVLGMLQYIGPIMQFLVGVFVFQEHMSQTRWIGFALVWLSLIVFTVDSFAAARRSRILRRNTKMSE